MTDWDLCTSASAVAKAGVHCSSLSGSGITMAKWYNEAAGTICLLTNTDWVSNYSSLAVPIKNALSDICSSYIATSLIPTDPTGYLTRESDTLMNRNDEIINKGIKALEGKSNTLKTP